MKRYALITGASRGIGRAIAIELAKDGSSMLLNYKSNHAAAEETKRLIEEVGGEAELFFEPGRAPHIIPKSVKVGDPLIELVN